MFETANDEEHNNTTRPIETPLLSSIELNDPKDENHVHHTEKQLFEESNFFKSNFDI